MTKNLNPYFNDCYFSENSGLDESLYVFIDGNNIPKVLVSKNQINICETGYGTGLNLMTLLSVIPKEQKINLNYTSVELYPISPIKIKSILSRFSQRIKDPYDTVMSEWENLYNKLNKGWNSCIFNYYNTKVFFNLFYGDVLDMLTSLDTLQDIWFLDGHSPDKNPEMWNYDILSIIGNKSSASATLSTYTAAGAIKQSLRNAGFFIKRRKGFANKHHMIQGWKVIPEQ